MSSTNARINIQIQLIAFLSNALIEAQNQNTPEKRSAKVHKTLNEVNKIISNYGNKTNTEQRKTN